MNRNALLSHLLRGTLVAGALATSLTTGVAFAQRGQGQGQGQGNDHRAAAAAGHGKPAHPGAASLAHRHGAKGTIASIDASKKSFVLSTKHGDLTVTTDEKTVYHAPKDEAVTFAMLAKDLRVMVQGERPSETALLAQRVNLLPAKDADDNKTDKDDKREAAGRTVTTGAVSGSTTGGSTFTLTPTGGAAVTYQITADTEITTKGTATFKDGATARVISKKDGTANVALKIRVPATA